MLLSRDEFDSRVSGLLTRNIEVLTPYEHFTGMKEKIQVKCSVCGHVWQPSLDNLIRGAGCPMCGRVRIATANRISCDEYGKRTQTFSEKKNIKVLTPFKEFEGVRTRVKAECLVCGRVWEPTFDSLMQGRGCPECAKSDMGGCRLSREEFDNRGLMVLERGVKILTPYEKFMGTLKKVDAECLTCGYTWASTFDNLIRGHGCYKCGRERSAATQRLTSEEYDSCMSTISEKKSIKILTPYNEYKSMHMKIQAECQVCGYVWMPVFNSLIRSAGCPNCFRDKGSSSLEEELAAALILQGLSFERHYRIQSDEKQQSTWEADFYFPEYRLAVEIHGLYWHSEEKKQKTYHRDKFDVFNSQGIHLLQIFEDEWRDCIGILRCRKEGRTIRKSLKFSNVTASTSFKYLKMSGVSIPKSCCR